MSVNLSRTWVLLNIEWTADLFCILSDGRTQFFSDLLHLHGFSIRDASVLVHGHPLHSCLFMRVHVLANVRLLWAGSCRYSWSAIEGTWPSIFRLSHKTPLTMKDVCVCVYLSNTHKASCKSSLCNSSRSPECYDVSRLTSYWKVNTLLYEMRCIQYSLLYAICVCTMKDVCVCVYLSNTHKASC